jgi:hypothetical protein
MVASGSGLAHTIMRIECAVLCLASLCGCASEATPEPIGPWFWMATGGFEGGDLVQMFRAGDRVELRGAGVRRAIGTLTTNGLESWEHALSEATSISAMNFEQCAPVDGIDICVDLQHESGPLQMCYCAFEPPPELSDFDGFFVSLAQALVQCESSSYIDLELCETE